MRYYHSGMKSTFSKVHGGDIGGGIEAGPNPDHPEMLPRPPMFGGGMVPLKKGGLAFGLVGHGWWHIGPGEYVDLPDTVSTNVIKNMAPQLFTKAEAVAAGMANEDGSLKAVEPRVIVPDPIAMEAEKEVEALLDDAPVFVPPSVTDSAPVRRSPGRPRNS